MKTLILAEIHDSTLLDVPDEELQEVLTLAKAVLTKDLPHEWDWVTIPLEAEVDVTPVGGTWHEKAEWVDDGGVWAAKA